MSVPAILALDFDGVVCDGRPEYFETAWQAYVAAWPQPLTTTRPAAVAERFSALRPLIESGWEMPLLIHALLAGVDARALESRHGWLKTAPSLLTVAGVSAETLGRALNRVRDEWFARDAPDWLAHHRFYPGVPARLVSLPAGPTQTVIVTTKTERFVRALLARRRSRLAAIVGDRARAGRAGAQAGDAAAPGRQCGLGRRRRRVLVRGGHAGDAGSDGPTRRRWPASACSWPTGVTTPRDRAHVASGGGRIALLALERFAAPLESWPN